MEGFDEKWQYSGTRRRASYTNLAPGDYTFRVLGANNDEVWDEKGTSIRVTITPPIYRTTAAYFAYSLLFVLSVIWWRRNDLKRQRIRNELQNQRFEAQKLREVDELKTNCFLPGAIADHLTSSGGVLFGEHQMSILHWLDAGATASYGTVTEPCAFPQKFPHPGIVIDRYTRGESLIEAYWKSVAWPGQGLFVGEPMAAPFYDKRN